MNALLPSANVRDGRLYHVRHSAATALLILAAPERVLRQLMGWPSTAMAACYQRVTAGTPCDAAQRVGGLIWEVATEGTEGAQDNSAWTR